MTDTKDSAFRDFLTDRNDILSNSAYQFLVLLCNTGDAKNVCSDNLLPRDAQLIDSLLEYAEAKVLREYSTCWPFYEDDDIPCYRGKDCKHPSCPFRNQQTIGG